MTDAAATERPTDRPPRLSVVVPVFNEQAVLPAFHGRLAAAMQTLGDDWEVLYVDDGSRDASVAIVESLAAGDPHVALLSLSRNFGKEIAMTAGLDHADGDAVVLIDADLQDPPELIPALVARWRDDGADVVYGQRRTRAGESRLKRLTAHLFYRTMRPLARVSVPVDTGDFRLLSRRAVLALRQLREQHRFMKGLFAWIGYRQVAVLYDREPRQAGQTKFGYWRLWNFAIEGVTSFTTVPLRIATYLGLLVSAFAFVFGAWIIAKTLIRGNPVPGYPSLIVVVLFLGGVQLAFIGILGEYVGRMFDESKRRPLYLVGRHLAGRGRDTP